MKHGHKIRVSAVEKGIFIAVFTFIFLLPLWLMLTSSFEESLSFARHGYSLVVYSFSTAAYEILFSDSLFWSSMLNSVWVTLATVALSLVVNVLTAYALSKKEMPLHKFFNFLFVFSMFFNAGMIPTYLIIRSLGMVDSFLALIIPPALGVYNILLIRNYIYSLPRAMEEAAMMDGANWFQLLWDVVIPVSKPVIVTTAFITLISKWNSWMDILLYISKTEEGHAFWTVQYYLRYLREAVGATNSAVGSDQVLSASIVVTVLPVCILFPFLQKNFSSGISLGAVKG